MTPAAKAVLLLTLNVERCPKFSLKCKQLWHFITKFAIVFQNTPSYKLRGHFHLPLGVFQLQVEPPLSCWSWEREMSKPQESVLQESHPAFQPGSGALLEEMWDFHMVLLKRNRNKGQMLLVGQTDLVCPSRLSKSCTGLPHECEGWVETERMHKSY